jgi:hypothetical protein
LWQEWKQVELDIKAMTEEIERIRKENALAVDYSRSPVSAHWSPPQP